MFKIHDKPLCLIVEWLAGDQLKSLLFLPTQKKWKPGTTNKF